jgi:hypothetical protein
VDGAANRRPAADAADLQGGAVPGTQAIEGDGLAGVARVTAPTRRQVGDHTTDRPMEPPELRRGQAAGGPGRVEAGGEQDLVRQQVADTGDPRLVEQPGL